MKYCKYHEMGSALIPAFCCAPNLRVPESVPGGFQPWAKAELGHPRLFVGLSLLLSCHQYLQNAWVPNFQDQNCSFAPSLSHGSPATRGIIAMGAGGAFHLHGSEGRGSWAVPVPALRDLLATELGRDGKWGSRWV